LESAKPTKSSRNLKNVVEPVVELKAPSTKKKFTDSLQTFNALKRINDKPAGSKKQK